MFHFCTYFDHNFLPRGLALYESLKQHCPSFRLWVLCMDEVCYHVLCQLHLPEVNLIRLEEFEEGDNELLVAKSNRARVEYYFTCTPSLPLYILNHCAQVDIITYLDADMYFFSDPAPIFEEFGEHSIAIVEHRFSHLFREHGYTEAYGIYNVGLLVFRRDENAFACLHWWREQCLAWCYDRLDEGRYADQKYLDDWPVRFQGVIALRHIGINLASWNVANYKFTRRGNHVWVDEQPLIVYHFHGVQHIAERVYNPNLFNYRLKLFGPMRKSIYAPYIKTLLEGTYRLTPLLPNVVPARALRDNHLKSASAAGISLGRRILAWLKDTLPIWSGVCKMRYLVVVNRYVI